MNTHQSANLALEGEVKRGNTFSEPKAPLTGVGESSPQRARFFKYSLPSGASQRLPPGPVIVDVAGTELTREEATRLRHPLVGGVILFARNFENRVQLSELCAAIHACRDGPLLISVDHEGGRVQRFRSDGFTALPAMRRLGEVWQDDPLNALRLATRTGYVLAAELRACGIDLSFTPVLDLDYGASSVIGDRAFHRDAKIVAQLARALVQGLQCAGMAACAKHFPGHGFVAADSHHDLPVDERELDAILSEDAAPYGWLGDLVLPAVMPAHVVYRAVDDLPAGFSPFWIQTVLRGQLHYEGLVFSDDLTMQGAAVAGDILARAQTALGAGCDMVLVCNRPDLADELLARLQADMSPASRARLQRLRPRGQALDWASLQTDSRYQQARDEIQGFARI